MPPFRYRALIISLVIYVLNAPLSVYNTAALFQIVERRYVPVQLSLSAIMILFAIIAGTWIGKHCMDNHRYSKAERWWWTIGFYVIGPPILLWYYRKNLRGHSDH